MPEIMQLGPDVDNGAAEGGCGGGTMPEVILPCPACGAVENESDKFGLSYRLGVQIVCHKCGMYGPVAEDFNEAVGKWNALPHALSWTHEPPKVAGWYWWRWAKFQEHMCLYVRDGLIVEYPHKQLRSVAEIGGQWSDGPIQAPAEPEES